MIFKILIILISIIVSWGIAYAITMITFWIDLNITNPDSEQMTYLKRKHLKMNKFIWLFVFIMIIFALYKTV